MILPSSLATYTNQVKNFGDLVPVRGRDSELFLEAGHSEPHESNPYNIIQVWANKV